MRRPAADGSATRFWTKMTVGLFAALLMTVWETVQSQHYHKDVSSLRRQVDRLTYENARMEMQIHQWESPSHLDWMARQQFKMGPLDSQHVIAIGSR